MQILSAVPDLDDSFPAPQNPVLVGTMSQVLGDKATEITVRDKEAREGEGNLIQVQGLGVRRT